jgi:hypothetical protein
MIQAGVVVLALAAALAPLPPRFVERWFSTGLFPLLQRQITPLVNLVPIALLDLLAVAAVIAVIAFLARTIRTARRERRAGPIVRGLATLVTGAAAVYLVFLVMWGFNYRRVPMSDRLAVAQGPAATDAVMALGLEAAAALTALHDEAHAAGWSTPPWQDAAFTAAFAGVQRQLTDAPAAVPGRLKPTLFGLYFRWTGVDGMINPFGLEVLANPDLLPYERPFIAAHEWAHLAGYADEAEASFVAFLTCMQAEAAARYSGWIFLYWQINAEVGEAGRSRMAAALGEGPRRDMAAIVARVRDGELPWLRTAGWEVYDQYLKANRVEEGVRSYGAAITLILQARFEDGWRPIRAGDR